MALTYVGCFEEPYYNPLFYKVYLDYRSQIDWNTYPDMSHVTQACAQAAVARQYTYFAITNYGVCVWGPDGHTVSSTRQADSWCFYGLGGPWLVSVYKIENPVAGKMPVSENYLLPGTASELKLNSRLCILVLSSFQNFSKRLIME